MFHAVVPQSATPRGRGELYPFVRGDDRRHAKAGHPHGHKGIQDGLSSGLSQQDCFWPSGGPVDHGEEVGVPLTWRWEWPHNVQVHMVVGCLVTLALLQAAHSLHQATISAARPDKAGGHQLPRGLLSSMREHRDMLKYCPPLGGWLQGAEGPSRGVTQEIDSLVDYHLQQQAGVVGQHILCLLAG